MIIGGNKFDVEHETYVMGILNVTPDSFSDGGKYNGMDQAMEHARQMVEDGADIIDVGGESTRPGHIMITDEEEIARVTPIIEKLKKEFDVPISIDTYKSKVAEAAVQAGADLVNDIWGLKYDKKIAGVIAKYNVACCLMHNRNEAQYQNFLEEMVSDMKECVAIAHKAGVPDETKDFAGAEFVKEGNYTITVTGIGNYEGSTGKAVFTISKNNSASTDPTNPSNPNGDKNVTDKKVSNNTNNVKPVVKNVAAKNNKNVPKTGDNANVLLWIALAVISCGVLAGAGVAVRKRK